ncbi:phosphoethanolamine transferase EptA [Sulfurospirillum diekertiae]|uniref:Phosphoethanolamine transferase EptA n=1 Tax=Sulfurospirillum diekertiae TaxID=1854492 RepID=A0A290HH84_9BACT|nr:phosphoethanolamine--lipid A transferase [Sulfurospirillum diekertiae]ATB70581.1 phosphoethanolamine transferase EptA [Sulfurospirillum diekertiae]
MPFKLLASHSQRAIALLALGIVAFYNITFFSKLFHFAINEENYLIALSSPFILMLMLVCILNVLLLLTHKTLFKVMLVTLIFAGALSSYFIDTFGTIIDTNMYTNMMQTDSAEILDLFTTKLFIYLGCASLLSFWVLFKAPFAFSSYTKEFIQKAFVALLSFLIIAGLYMSLSKSYSTFFRNHNELKMYINPAYPIASFVKFVYAKLKPKPTFMAIAMDATRQSSEKKKLVVFVLGETARARNFQLNGYDVPTNPLLSKRDDIVNLPNFASCGTATAISVPCMFSKFSRNDWSDDKAYTENIVDVLARTGVRIIWRDNNSGADKEIAKRMSDVVQYGGRDFDSVLLKDFQANIDKQYEDTFIVLHQEGSHGPTYFKRYPEAFKKFTPTCDTQELDKCTQEQIVNTYNNTILYTDYIVNETINLLKANEDKYETTLIYISDHGESLGENGVYLHGLPYMIAPEDQKHVPALFYFGDKAKREFLHVKANERFSQDNLFHTLLGLFAVKTSEYKPTLDLLH